MIDIFFHIYIYIVVYLYPKFFLSRESNMAGMIIGLISIFSLFYLCVASSVDRERVNGYSRTDATVLDYTANFDRALPVNSVANLRKQTSNAKQPTAGTSNKTLIRRPTVKRVIHPSLHAVWDEYNHLCALAKFQATFTIKYDTISGTSQLIDKMPANARSRGRCDQFDENEPKLDVMWNDSQLTGGSLRNQNGTGGFNFRIIFQKYPKEGCWGVQQMQLAYNTGHPVFRGALSPKKYIVRSNKEDHRLQFRTEFGSSMLCPSPPPIQMYDGDRTLRVIARLSNMQLQAFEFSDPREGSNFDSFKRCGQVSFGSGVARQITTIRNDALTFFVGLMTVCIATLTVVGYAIYRSNLLKTRQYKTMG